MVGELLRPDKPELPALRGAGADGEGVNQRDGRERTFRPFERTLPPSEGKSYDGVLSEPPIPASVRTSVSLRPSRLPSPQSAHGPPESEWRETRGRSRSFPVPGREFPRPESRLPSLPARAAPCSSASGDGPTWAIWRARAFESWSWQWLPRSPGCARPALSSSRGNRNSCRVGRTADRKSV